MSKLHAILEQLAKMAAEPSKFAVWAVNALPLEVDDCVALFNHIDGLGKAQDKHVHYIKYLEHCLKVLESHFLIRLLRRFGCLRIKPYKSSLVD